jgi:hypothetical protein
VLLGHIDIAHPLRAFPTHTMSSGDLNIAATTVLRPSPDFCVNGADVVIRPAGGPDFPAHKAILSLVSPVFKDMFTLPQLPSNKQETLPHVDVQDSPKTWEIILRTIYPTVPNPTIDTLDDLQSLLSAAQTYEMECVIEVHKKAFENRAFILEDPLHLFSIACTCGFEDQATYVARNAELKEFTRRFDPSNLKGLTFGAYGRLVSFLAERDSEWHRILRSARYPSVRYCSCESDTLCDNVKQVLHCPYLQAEEVYLTALEHRSDSTLGCAGSCRLSYSKIKEFVEEMMKKKVKVNDKFQPAKWYCKRMITFVQILPLTSISGL